jgi:acetyl esterase/lipase
MNVLKTPNAKTNRFTACLLMVLLLLTACEKSPFPTGGNDGPPPVLPTPLTERIILDTAYGSHPQQKMDIYLPAGRSNATKLIVMIHGGGWSTGDKSSLNYYKNLLRAKWPEAAIANINYRLASNAANIHHAEIMSDVSNAVQFMVSNRNYFSISDTLAMMGESAGGHLALLYTYAHNSGNYVKCVGDIYGPAQINDWSWYNSFNIFIGQSVSSMLSQYTGAPWTTATTPLYESVSPMMRVNAQSKPTIIFHGTIDVVVPLYQSQWLNAKLQTLGVPHEYTEYFLDGHGFNAPNTNDCANRMVSFFKRYAK